MRCAGCNRELEVGDRYIEDTASGFIDADPEPEIDGLIAMVFGGCGDKVRYCEGCTEMATDGKYLFKTVYGDGDGDGEQHG